MELDELLALQRETVRAERRANLLDRLATEVGDRHELVLGLRREIADRLDANTLEAVVGADAELELLDREVLHPVHDRRLGDGLGSGLAEALDRVEIREDRELTNEDLGRLADRIARFDRAIGRDVEDELVVVRAQTDARGLDLVGDPANGREDRVDRDDADRGLGPAVQLGRDVAAATPDGERDLQLALVRDMRDLELRESLDVGGRDDAGALLGDVHLDLGRRAVQADDEALEVEDAVGDVLAHAGERRELVGDALDLHGGDGCALQRGEQHPAKRVPEGVPEAAIERLDGEHAAMLVGVLVDDLRDLEVHQAGSYCHVSPFLRWCGELLLRVELDDERLLDRSIDLVALGPLEHGAGEPVVVGLQPGRHGSGEIRRVAHELLDRAALLQRDDVRGTHAVARDVHPATVDLEVPVPHELSRLCAGAGEAEPVDDVVEARLEHPQEVLAGGPETPRRLLVRRAELLLEKPVVAARLLLLAELEQILALLDAPAAVLSGWIAAALYSALLGEAALALQEELDALTATETALGAEIAGHQTRLRFR